MTARAGLFTFITAALCAIPATAMLALGVPYAVFFYALPLAAFFVAAPAFSRWIPAAIVRRWAKQHDVDLTQPMFETLRHVAAHSGFPCTNPGVVLEHTGNGMFYVSRKNIAMMRMFEDPALADKNLRHVIRRSGVLPPMERLREAVAAGATPTDIFNRLDQSGASLDETLQSFIDGLPQEFFLAMLEDTDA